MGNIICCGDSYLPIEERYNSHHRTYNEDPLLPSHANNTKYNYHNSRNVIKFVHFNIPMTLKFVKYVRQEKMKSSLGQYYLQKKQKKGDKRC